MGFISESKITMPKDIASLLISSAAQRDIEDLRSVNYIRQTKKATLIIIFPSPTHLNQAFIGRKITMGRQVYDPMEFLQKQWIRLDGTPQSQVRQKSFCSPGIAEFFLALQPP